MFRGITAVTIDNKGRFALPARYRAADEADRFWVITIDTEESCLLLYTAKQWEIIEAQLQKLPSFNNAARRIQRLLIGHATDLELDTNGRFLVPTLLREYANLEKKIVLIGQGHKFEIWDEAHWQQKRSQWLAAKSNESLPDEWKDLWL